MESQIDQIIQQAVQPYIFEIENLKQRLRDREIELAVLKNAIFGIDTKFTEIEKKAKVPATSAAKPGATRAAAGSSSTRAAVGAKTTGAAQQTPRGNSRAPEKPATAGARERSKTPAGGRMQNALNSSMTSKLGNTTTRSGTSGTRSDSKSRNGDL